MRNWRDASPGWIFVPLFVLLIVLAICAPADAHTEDAYDAWHENWIWRLSLAGDLNVDLMTELTEFQRVHIPPLSPPPSPQSSLTATKTAPEPTEGVFRGMGAGVEQWRSLVALYFPEQVDFALLVIDCESGGNPNAYNPSGASGLFQVLASWADNFGYVPAQLFDPVINVSVARILYDDGGWRHWRASAGCWG